MSAGAVVGAIGRLAGGVAAVGSVEQAIHRLAAASTAAIEPVAHLAKSLTHFLAGPLDLMKALAGELGPLVGLFNPGIVQQFTLAMNDAQAVLGSALLPVMRGMTDYTRRFGDALAGLLPVVQPLFDTIGVYISMFGEGLYQVLTAGAPLIQTVTDALSAMLVGFTQLEAGLIGLTVALMEMVTDLLGLESRFDANATSRGFAARQTKVSSVQQFADDVFSSTARNIYARDGGGKKPEALMAEIKKAIEDGKKTADLIKDEVVVIANWFRAHAKEAGDFGRGVGGGAAGATKDDLKDLFKWFGIRVPW